MKKLLGLLFLAGALAGGAARGQEAPRGVTSSGDKVGEPLSIRRAPEYVPIVIDRAQWDRINAHLGEQPAKFAIPLMQWLNELEAAAKQKWEAENAPKETPKP